MPDLTKNFAVEATVKLDRWPMSDYEGAAQSAMGQNMRNPQRSLEWCGAFHCANCFVYRNIVLEIWWFCYITVRTSSSMFHAGVL